MKYITVTKEVRAKNQKLFKNAVIGSIYRRGLPNSFNGVLNQEGGYKNSANHEADGWFPFIAPIYEPATQKLGAFIFNENDKIFTQEVIQKSSEEKQEEQREDSEQKKAENIIRKAEKEAEKEAQSLTDEEAVAQAELYPFWEPNLDIAKDDKYQDFDSSDTLKLYKALQNNPTDKPKDNINEWTALN